MRTVEVCKDWQILQKTIQVESKLNVNYEYMIQHIPSKKYIGGKIALTSKTDIDHKSNFKTNDLYKAKKFLYFVAGLSIIETEKHLNCDTTPISIPKNIHSWYFETLGTKEKFDGNDIFRIIQDVIKVSNDQNTWGDYNIDKSIVEYAEKNEETFLKLLTNCSKNVSYSITHKK